MIGPTFFVSPGLPKGCGPGVGVGRAAAPGFGWICPMIPPIGRASGVPWMIRYQSSQPHIGSFQSLRSVRGWFSYISLRVVGSRPYRR